MTCEESMAQAERAIQRILLNLEEDTGRRIEMVNVDTRNFANCSVEVSLVEKAS